MQRLAMRGWGALYSERYIELVHAQSLVGSSCTLTLDYVMLFENWNINYLASYTVASQSSNPDVRSWYYT